jgi:hypothetical protein
MKPEYMCPLCYTDLVPDQAGTHRCPQNDPKVPKKKRCPYKGWVKLRS